MQWPEVYATQAIALLNEAADDEAYLGKRQDQDEWLHEWRILDHASTWIVEATDIMSDAQSPSF